MACAIGGGFKRVLIVDDRRNLADSLAIGLRALGYQASVAYDGRSALNTAAAFHPEVAVLDIGLPGMDGYELARRLRQTPRTEKMRLIALTGYGQDTHGDRSEEAGFDAHLVKPVQLERLQEVIEGDDAGHGQRRLNKL